MDEEMKKALDGLKAELQAGIKAEVEAAQKGLITAEQLTAKLTEVGADKEAIEKLTTAVKAQGDKLREIEAAPKDKQETLGEIVKRVHPEVVKALAGVNDKFTMKVPVNKTTVGLSSITSDPMGMFIPGFARIASQRLTILPSLAQFPLGPDSHGIIYWTDQATRTNNAAARSDGSAAGEQVYAWTGYSETVDNISAAIPVHIEALKHISMMESELKGLLDDDVRVKAEDYAYTGSGTSPQIGGLYTRATAFDAAAYIAAGGATPERANQFDLIMAMAAQIMKGSKYNVDTVWVNPYSSLSMWLEKDANGMYVVPPFVVKTATGEMLVKNIRVIESNSVTANTLVVGDSSKARVYFGDNIELTMGYNTSGDFTKRIITILANMELSLLIRNAEVDAFLKSTNVAGDVAAITKATA